MALPVAVRRILPLLVLAGLGLFAFLVLVNPPEARRAPPPQVPAIAVEVLPVVPRDFPVQLTSYGTVQPRTQSMLVAQVGGQILSVAPAFRNGGFFRAGDVLLTIDPRDYQADEKIADAALADARQALAQEEALGEQARADWQRLGKTGTPGTLVLREPQLQAARARVASAEAALAKARLDVERTRVQAPFAGRLLAKHVDLGQVISPGAQLAEVYATDLVEVRLPLRNADLAFVDLPEGEAGASLPATVYSTLGTREAWPAEVVRTEGAIDATARQLHVVAQVAAPFLTGTGRRPLKIGEYVTAELRGRVIEGALVVPADSIYQNSFLWLVREGVLERRDVQVAWQDGAQAVVSDGLQPGDEVVLTPLGQVTSGLPARVVRRAVAGGAADGGAS